MSFSEILTRYRDETSRVNSYIDLAFQQDARGDFLRSEDEIEFLVTSAFLKQFLAWEQFLESSFIAYMTGLNGLDGTCPLRYVEPVDEGHANKILIGTQRYVDWANHEIVKRIASLYFERGEPYNTAINSVSRELSDCKIIRNASAHNSSTTQTAFEAVVSRVLSDDTTNMSISKFLTAISPEDTSNTVMQQFQLKLDITAENIAWNRT